MNRKKNSPLLILQMVILSCGSITRLSHAGVQCNGSEVQLELRKNYPGWQVVRLEDLRSEDRDLWVKQHGIDCPGIFEAHLKSQTYKSFVLTIFKKNRELQQILLIVDEGKGSHPVTVLDGPRKVAYLSVVSKMSPGAYWGVDGRKVDVSLDSVLYEAIEAGSTLYYFRDGRFSYISVSE
ncbi:MAG TPA: hypothetical protein VME63_03615 [Dyella sp.]|uniref:hypothetical protein n=1 Tax=Dyella sp. TaxID=1869338 RepID=UPI002C471802|nr:hypothetical protein [Dyella sp.]HTV84463.1 hypothetical protein [Dyella sp.]